jgi:hypothetical protein
LAVIVPLFHVGDAADAEAQLAVVGVSVDDDDAELSVDRVASAVVGSGR